MTYVRDVAIEITTLDSTPVVERYSVFGCMETDGGDWFPARLAEVGDVDISLPSPEVGIVDDVTFRFSVQHQAGAAYGALAAGTSYDRAIVRAFVALDGEFDATDASALFFKGVVESASVNDDRIDYDCRWSVGSYLDQELPKRTFDGFSNAEDEIKSKHIPILIGDHTNGARFVEAFCVDPTATDPKYKVADTEDSGGTEQIDLNISHIINTGPEGSDSTIDGNARLIRPNGWNPEKGVKQMRSPKVNRDAFVIAEQMRGGSSANEQAKGEFTIDTTYCPKTAEEADRAYDYEETEDGAEPERVTHEMDWLGDVSSLGNPVADEIDPYNDRIIVKCIGNNVYKPSSGGKGGTADRPGEILWTWLVSFLGMPEADIDAPTFFQSSVWSSGTQADLTMENIGYLDEPRSVRDWAGLLLWENGGALTFDAGLLTLKKIDYSPSSPTIAYTITPDNARDFEVVPGRFGEFFNVLLFRCRGHALDRNQYNLYAEKHTNSASVTKYGKVRKTYTCEFLNGQSSLASSVDTRVDEILAFHSAGQEMARVKVQPPWGDIDTVLGINPGDYVNVVWGAEDPDAGVSRASAQWSTVASPAECLVTGARKNYLDGTSSLLVVRTL